MNLDANAPPVKVIQVGLGGFGRSWAQLTHGTNGISMTGAGRSLSRCPGLGSQRARCPTPTLLVVERRNASG